MGRGRRTAVWILIAVASVLGLVATLSIWVNRQLLSGVTSTQSNTQLVQDPVIRHAVASYLVDQLYANVDVSQQLSDRLPSQLQRLAAPAAAALREPAVTATDYLLSQPQIQSVFASAASKAEQQLINVLENKTGYGVTSGSGNVQVDLSELIRQVGKQLGIPSSALDKLPASAGQVTVMRSDQLSTAQQAVQIVRVLGTWLIVLVIALFALAVYLAIGRRRETLRSIGWAFIIVGLIVLVARRLIGDYVIGSISTGSFTTPAQHVWVLGTSTLGDLGWATILYGVLIVIAAWIAGPMRPAVAVRRWIAPVLNRRPGIAWTAVAIAFILVVLWGGTHALTTPWGILTLGALLAAGVYALRIETLQEFPDAEPGFDVRDTVTSAVGSVRGFASSHRPSFDWRRGGRRAASAELDRLAELHGRGVISDEEFAQAKQRLLEGGDS
jgi:hypothetical protein